MKLSRFLHRLVWLVLLSLVGCQMPARTWFSHTPTPPPVRGKLVIAWIPKALDNPVFEVGRQGALRRASELSASGPVDVEILYVGSVSADAAEQARVVEDVIARGVDAIAISCNDPTACIDPIDRAVATGIPVMTWDADSPESGRFTFLGMDNYQGGQAAAHMLVDAMGTSGKVALLTGVPGAFNLEERIRGFRDGVAQYPEIEIVATVITNDDINLGVQVVEETMQAYPDLSGWFFVGMWPLFAERGSMPLWEKASLQQGMKTVAFDALPVELELLRDGYLVGLIDQKNWGWGYNAVQVAYDHLILGKTFQPFTDLGFNIITQNNVEALLNAWETNDFSQPLPDP